MRFKCLLRIHEFKLMGRLKLRASPDLSEIGLSFLEVSRTLRSTPLTCSPPVCLRGESWPRECLMLCMYAFALLKVSTTSTELVISESPSALHLHLYCCPRRVSTAVRTCASSLLCNARRCYPLSRSVPATSQ